MFLVAIFLFSLFILHSTTGVTSEPSGVERNALLTFMSKVNHPRFINWNESKPACSWKGITCDPNNKTVIYLRLRGKSLTGEIAPNTIGMLTNLRVLSLGINRFTGKIPPDFARLTHLSRLMLENNLFSGQLAFITADYLTTFNVSHNNLSTSIPSSLSKFPPSAFSGNVFVCGIPFLPCNQSYPTPTDQKPAVAEEDETHKQKREIVGVSMGSTVLLLIFFCSAGKNLYQWIKPRSSTTDIHSNKESNKLVLFDGDFDSEDLLSASKEILGEGSFGLSFKQQVLVGKKMMTVVVKRLKDVVVNENEFREKMEVLGRMKNKNLVPLKGFFYNYSKDEKYWLVYDYMPAGSLSAYLHGCIGSLRTRLNWDRRMRIALSAAKGLTCLHVVGEEVHGNINHQTSSSNKKPTMKLHCLTTASTHFFTGQAPLTIMSLVIMPQKFSRPRKSHSNLMYIVLGFCYWSF